MSDEETVRPEDVPEGAIGAEDLVGNRPDDDVEDESADDDSTDE